MKSVKRVILFVVLIAVIGMGITLYQIYNKIYKVNTRIPGPNSEYFYIPTESTIEDVEQALFEQGYLINRSSFLWLAEVKNYHRHVKPGRYLLSNKMSNNELINLLRSGEQIPVDVTFNNVRTINELAGIVGRKLETDSTSIVKLLRDDGFVSQYGFTRNKIITMFIPNTYEFHWNTSATQFVDRMAREYKIFWTDARKSKAKKLGLSQSEVSILASIVQAEQSIRIDERPKVAGLYVNRLRKKMRLQSDPTIIFAIGDFNIQRVLDADRKIDSPYNTYKYAGLPPGPICLPEISSIKAVLNYEQHDYLYMCAKEDFSGYHNFAKTNRQHNIYAARYRRELNKRKIYR